MTFDELIATYPRLYHLTDPANLDSLRRHGLLSTSALLDKWQVPAADRPPLEAARREDAVTLSHPLHGTAKLRDNKPITPAGLAKCLVGIDAAAWFRLLNGRVFLWPTRRRVETLLSARYLRGSQQAILTLDTAKLVERHGGRIELAPYNTGATLHTPPKRGLFTFVPVADYPFDEWRGKRSASTAVTEVTVLGGVPDVWEFVVDVERRDAGADPVSDSRAATRPRSGVG